MVKSGDIYIWKSLIKVRSAFICCK
eukprot:UN14602